MIRSIRLALQTIISDMIVRSSRKLRLSVCRHPLVRVGLSACLLLASCATSWGKTPHHGGGLDEWTFFAFDDHSIPWKDNLRLTLVSAEKYPGNPVLRCGPQGTPDHGHALLYGSVLKIAGRFHMWYLGMGQRELVQGQAPEYWRPMCYAVSDDGINWTKPNLGLVDYYGNLANNICLINSDNPDLARIDDFLSVMVEPDDPDPERRFKAAFVAHVPWKSVPGGVRNVGVREPRPRLCAMICATSADG